MKNRLRSLNRLVQTVRHLKPVQVVYQLRYRCYSPGSLRLIEEKTPTINPLEFYPVRAIAGEIQTDQDHYRVTYLNLTATFKNEIDWSYSKYGKLWNYHLQYADFLRQEDLSTEIKSGLMTHLYQMLTSGRLAPEPYPASLRIMNVIRFLSTELQEAESRKELIHALSSELEYLANRPEYHLMGNHLLENAFALLMGGEFLSKPYLVHQAEKILKQELDEQILDDGAHFERSPMYHKIILFRILEAVYYLPDESGIHRFLKKKAERMLGWLHEISFSDGTIPHFNDSTEGIAQDTAVLKEMAKNAGIEGSDQLKLNESGYRKLTEEPYELIVDLEGIKPDYQPGHAHADSLSFQLNISGIPIVTDPGITTYETGKQRDLERSTRMHNTVTVNNENTADVWGGFRVGYRPEVKVISDDPHELKAVLHSKQPLKFTHQRTFSIQNSQLTIEDLLDTGRKAVVRFHLHPAVEINRKSDRAMILNQKIGIQFEGAESVRESNYSYSTGFNRPVYAHLIEVHFYKNLKTVITID